MMSHPVPSRRGDQDFTDIDRFFEGTDLESADISDFYGDTDVQSLWCLLSPNLRILKSVRFRQSFI
jgi:hypothetical protein